ncbi:MAG: hypothetical protein QXN68_00730 [Thermoplasmata archaeon]
MIVIFFILIFNSMLYSQSAVRVVNTPSVIITSGTVNTNISISTPLPTEVVNTPSVIITSGTVKLDNVINRVVIRDGNIDRNLNINTYNGLDVRLLNNTGTLISETTPLPVNYIVFTSTYIETNGSFTIKSGSGYLFSVLVGKSGISSDLIVNDGSKKIVEIDTTVIGEYKIPIKFSTDLNITTTGTTPAKITIIYR